MPGRPTPPDDEQESCRSYSLRPSVAKAEAPEQHDKRAEKPEAKCPRHPDKDYRKLVDKAWKAGWWCEERRKYIYCRPPDKKLDIVKIPMTPNQRTIHNVKRNLRASGLDV
jgi:hypothetical protein